MCIVHWRLFVIATTLRQVMMWIFRRCGFLESFKVAPSELSGLLLLMGLNVSL
jgi:hypothetical protein